MDVEEVSPWCEQMFLGKEKGCFSPWLFYTFWEYMDLSQLVLQSQLLGRRMQEDLESKSSPREKTAARPKFLKKKL
jgi:hypothetical protein